MLLQLICSPMKCFPPLRPSSFLVAKVEYLAIAMFNAYGNKFDGLSQFISTVKRIWTIPMELIPAKSSEPCIVRRLK